MQWREVSMDGLSCEGSKGKGVDKQSADGEQQEFVAQHSREAWSEAESDGEQGAEMREQDDVPQEVWDEHVQTDMLGLRCSDPEWVWQVTERMVCVGGISSQMREACAAWTGRGRAVRAELMQASEWMEHAQLVLEEARASRQHLDLVSSQAWHSARRAWQTTQDGELGTVGGFDLRRLGDEQGWCRMHAETEVREMMGREMGSTDSLRIQLEHELSRAQEYREWSAVHMGRASEWWLRGVVLRRVWASWLRAMHSLSEAEIECDGSDGSAGNVSDDAKQPAGRISMGLGDWTRRMQLMIEEHVREAVMARAREAEAAAQQLELGYIQETVT